MRGSWFSPYTSILGRVMPLRFLLGAKTWRNRVCYWVLHLSGVAASLAASLGTSTIDVSGAQRRRLKDKHVRLPKCSVRSCNGVLVSIDGWVCKDYWRVYCEG